MATATQSNVTGKKSFGQTVKQSMKVLGGKEVPNYSLLFLSPTKNHKRGDHETIVYPYIELGRSSTCVVQYDETFPTVSRKHTALRFENGQVVVKQLSATNPTIVTRGANGGSEFLTENGQETELHNGDELQLSADGPRLRFNATPTKTSTLGMTQRLQLFRRQALKPYKQAVTAMAIMLVALSGLGFYLLNDTNNKLAAANEQIEESQSLIGEMIVEREQMEKRLKTANEAEAKKLRGQIAMANRKIKQIQEENLVAKSPVVVSGGGSSSGGASPVSASTDVRSLLSKHYGSVYYISVQDIKVHHPDGVVPVVFDQIASATKWSGTGFLTTDGKFITARHVIQGWRFSPGCDIKMLYLNASEMQGYKVSTIFLAESPTGDKFTFTNDEVQFSEDGDIVTDQYCKGNRMKINNNSASDWAFVPMGSKRGTIPYAEALSANLKTTNKVYSLGYSYGLQLQSNFNPSQLSPLYSTSDVAKDGLTNGVINITSVGFGSGSSGGPVFAYHNGEMKAVGIVSHSIGGNIGGIIPLANVRY